MKDHGKRGRAALGEASLRQLLDGAAPACSVAQFGRGCAGENTPAPGCMATPKGAVSRLLMAGA